MSTTPEDHSDLYCIACGYSLRGLTGEQLRCPECGEMNPISGEPVPDVYLAREMRLMETPGTFCVMLFLIGWVPVVVLACHRSRPGWRSESDDTVLCSGITLLLVAMMWFTMAVTFVRQCSRWQAGVRLLVVHHLVGLCIPLLCVGLWWMRHTRVRWDDLLLSPWMAIGITVVTIGAMVLVHRRLRPWRAAAFRAEATRRAREEVRQVMRTPRRK